jgi:hypothetical protein
LSDDYLKANPVSKDEIYLPPAFKLQPHTPFAPVPSPSESIND